VLPLPPGSTVGDRVTCIVRAEGITWHAVAVSDGLPARVIHRRFAGSRVALEVALADAGPTLGCEDGHAHASHAPASRPTRPPSSELSRLTASLRSPGTPRNRGSGAPCASRGRSVGPSGPA
jgi:hypothetical protein